MDWIQFEDFILVFLCCWLSLLWLQLLFFAGPGLSNSWIFYRLGLYCTFQLHKKTEFASLSDYYFRRGFAINRLRVYRRKETPYLNIGKIIRWPLLGWASGKDVTEHYECYRRCSYCVVSFAILSDTAFEKHDAEICQTPGTSVVEFRIERDRNNWHPLAVVGGQTSMLHTNNKSHFLSRAE